MILDGFDEYEAIVATQLDGKSEKVNSDKGGLTKQCNPEVGLVIQRRKMQNINLVVTSRPWKAEELLYVEKYEYQKIDMNTTLTETERNAIISNFYRNPERSQELISFIDKDIGDIVPRKMTKEPRMLLYICNIWDQDIDQRNKVFSSRSLFIDATMILMLKTYNVKYPENKKGQQWLDDLKGKLISFGKKNKHNNMVMKWDDFFNEFGDNDLAYDLWCMGLFTSEKKKTAPWEEKIDEDLAEVNLKKSSIHGNFVSKTIKPQKASNRNNIVFPAYPELFEEEGN